MKEVLKNLVWLIWAMVIAMISITPFIIGSLVYIIKNGFMRGWEETEKFLYD